MAQSEVLPSAAQEVAHTFAFVDVELAVVVSTDVVSLILLKLWLQYLFYEEGVAVRAAAVDWIVAGNEDIVRRGGLERALDPIPLAFRNLQIPGGVIEDRFGLRIGLVGHVARQENGIDHNDLDGAVGLWHWLDEGVPGFRIIPPRALLGVLNLRLVVAL